MGTPHQSLFRLATTISRLPLYGQPAGAAPRQALRPGSAFPTFSVVFALGRAHRGGHHINLGKTYAKETGPTNNPFLTTLSTPYQGGSCHQPQSN